MDERGVIAALALDQRGMLKNMLVREFGAGTAPPETIMSEFQMRTASIPLDVEYGLSAARKINGKGLLLAYEKSGTARSFLKSCLR